jgi:hypothetical protein
VEQGSEALSHFAMGFIQINVVPAFSSKSLDEFSYFEVPHMACAIIDHST